MKVTPVPELSARSLLDRIKEEAVQKALRTGEVNVMKEQDAMLLEPFDNTVSFEEFISKTDV